jgi:hypothetical protein
MLRRMTRIVRFSCSMCRSESRITTTGLELASIEIWAELVVGRSRFFVAPIEKDDPGPAGRCAQCGERALDFEILAPEA